MNNSYKYVGKSFPIQDAELKVTGEQKYLDDIKFAGLLYGKLLFSTVAHGNIKSIDISRAEALPGVIRVFTHENTPTERYNDYAFFVDQEVPKDERIFNEKARFFGDRIGGVVAESKEIAEEAIKLITVEYEELEPTVKLQQGEFIREATLNFGDADEGIRTSPHTFENRITTQKVHHAAMENHVCVADYDRLGNLTIWTPCQSVFGIRTVVADLLHLSYSKVRVIKTILGGSFGGKQHALLEPVTAFMAMSVKRPVKLLFERSETILSTVTRTATDISVTTGLDEKGEIIACNIRAITDAGAYVGNTNDLSIAMGKKAFRVYRIPNLNYRAKSVLTNTAISGGCRGWGGPQICTAIEVHFDSIAKKMGLDPADFRMKNLVHPYDMENATKITLGNARIRECLAVGMEKFDWKTKKGLEKGENRFRKGFGLACGGHVNGFFGKIQDISSMTLRMNEDGSFILNTGTHEQGCGTLISMAQIVGEVLSTKPDRINVLEADTERSPYDLGTFSSRVTYVAGKCAFLVASKIKDRILEYGARIFNISKSYIVMENEFVWVVGHEDRKLSFREIATTVQLKNQEDIIETVSYNNVSNPGSYGAHFAEVLVDTFTGMVKVTDYLAVHDIGQIINKGMVDGQVKGCVQMGIGMALCEELKYDEKGKPLNSDFAKYTVVNSPDMPEVRCEFLEFGEDDGPFGAKSIGEVAVVPVAGAIVNAVNDALGLELCDLPLTPEKIIAAFWGE